MLRGRYSMQPPPSPNRDLRFRKEARRNVRVHVIELAFGKLRQNGCGCRPRARPDFDHPETPPCGQSCHERPDRIPEQPVGSKRDRRVQIQISRGRVAGAEQQRERIHPAAKHLGQRGTAAPEQTRSPLHRADEVRPIGRRTSPDQAGFLLAGDRHARHSRGNGRRPPATHLSGPASPATGGRHACAHR